MKNVNKKILKLLLAACLITNISTTVYAEDNDKLIIQTSQTFDDKLWKPNDSDNTEISILNKYDEDVVIDRFTFKMNTSINNESNEILDKDNESFIDFSQNSYIKLIVNDKTIYHDTLDNVLKDSGMILTDPVRIKPDEEEVISLIIELSENMSNLSQGLENDIQLGVVYEFKSGKPDIDDGNDGNEGEDNNNGNDGNEGEDNNNGNGGNQGGGNEDNSTDSDNDIDKDESIDRLPNAGSATTVLSTISVAGVIIIVGYLLFKKKENNKA